MNCVQAVIFDLDGVLVSTDQLHYQAWKKLADQLNFPFNSSINNKLRGVDRISSLKLILPTNHHYCEDEILELADRKNQYYKKLLPQITPDNLLPGAAELLTELRNRKIKKAVASASKNAITVLNNLNIIDQFDTIVTGNDFSNGKPDPEIFLLAAQQLGELPQNCIVIEDAQVGIDAANTASMISIGMDNTGRLERTDKTISSLNEFSLESIAPYVTK